MRKQLHSTRAARDVSCERLKQPYLSAAPHEILF